MKELTFDYWGVGHGESCIHTTSPELAKDLWRVYEKRATYEWHGKIVEWQFIVPGNIVQFYYRRFVSLTTQNRVLKSIEIEGVRETSSKEFARGKRSVSKAMLDMGPLHSGADLQKSGSSGRISEQEKAPANRSPWKENKP
jgi:hypothetical protein